MAEALGWPAGDISWLDLFDLATNRTGWTSKNHPEWGALKFGHAHPNVSVLSAHCLLFAVHD